MRKIGPEQREGMRQSFAKKIMNVMRTQGFGALKIQDMAQLMDISKATLYNYFSSKEDIILEVGNIYMDYLQDFDQKITDQQIPYHERFLKVFEQEALSSIYTSGIFLNDLRAHCPFLYEKISAARKKRIDQIERFYEQGMKDGAFYEMNPKILIMQDMAVFQRIFEPGFLIDSGLTYNQALYDLYKIKKIQLLKNGSEESDSDKVKETMDHVLYKLSNAGN